jgi:PPOX class probable F420-dependent enzyme
MALKRSQITLTEEEMQAFLDEERVVTLATIGPNGRPHLMPLWYVVDKGLITGWTFAKSQKVRNLERLPQATLQIEAGCDRYSELRGVMLECDVEILRDQTDVEAIGLALARRYAGLPPGAPVSDEARAGVLKQAPKRVGMRFTPTRVVSWDHRKLGGRY